MSVLPKVVAISGVPCMMHPNLPSVKAGDIKVALDNELRKYRKVSKGSSTDSLYVGATSVANVADVGVILIIFQGDKNAYVLPAEQAVDIMRQARAMGGRNYGFVAKQGKLLWQDREV